MSAGLLAVNHLNLPLYVSSKNSSALILSDALAARVKLNPDWDQYFSEQESEPRII